MKERKRRQSLGGAVLIMVLTVMFILIILLMAALTTVSTANQRIFTKFEENQAYYTARSGLDVFLQNIIDDSNYKQYEYNPATGAQGSKVQYIYGDNKKTDMKQGLGLQLDRYSITAQSGMNIKQSALYAYANSITESTDKKDEYKHYFGVMPGTSGSSDGPVINEIYYEVELPKLAGSSNGKDVSKAKIKLEVLERKYDMDNSVTTTYNGVTKSVKEHVESFDPKDEKYQENLDKFMNDATCKNDIAKAIANGNREEDTMRIKITATTDCAGVEGKAVVIADTYKPNQVSSARSITSLSDLSEGSGMFPIGGASALFKGEVRFAQASITTGDIFLEDSLWAQDLHQFITRGSNVILAKGDVTWKNMSAPDIYTKGATMFIGGTLTMDSSTKNGAQGNSFGSAGREGNLVVGTLKYGGDGCLESGFYGNIYCDTLDLSSDNNSKFKVVNGSAYANTLVLSAGSWTDGDGVLHITVNVPASAAAVKVGSDVIAMQKNWDGTVIYKVTDLSGTRTVVNGAGIPVGAVVDISGALPTPNSANKVNIDFDDYTKNPVEEGDRVFTMPANIIVPAGAPNTKEIRIPTHQALYADYFHDGTFNDTTGAFAFTPSSPTLTDAQWQAEFRAFLDNHVIKSEEKLEVTTLDKYSNYVTVKPRDPSDTLIPATFTSVISESGRLKESDNNGNTNNYGLTAIDARANPIEIQLGSDSATGESYYAGIFVVYGDNPVRFLLAGNQKINIGATTSTCVFKVYSKDIFEATELRLGNTPNPTPEPNIDLFVAKSVPAVAFGHQSFVCGYFYAPMSKFDLAGGMNGEPYFTKYDNVQIYYSTPSEKVAYGVAGSVFCHGYSSAQKVGVAYIERGGPTPGDPIHNHQAYWYLRG